MAGWRGAARSGDGGALADEIPVVEHRHVGVPPHLLQEPRVVHEVVLGPTPRYAREGGLLGAGAKTKRRKPPTPPLMLQMGEGGLTGRDRQPLVFMVLIPQGHHGP